MVILWIEKGEEVVLVRVFLLDEIERYSNVYKEYGLIKIWEEKMGGIMGLFNLRKYLYLDNELKDMWLLFFYYLVFFSVFCGFRFCCLNIFF